MNNADLKRFYGVNENIDESKDFVRLDSDWVIDGKCCDIKLFATALTADDVSQLYNNKAVIDNQGNIYCDCIETKSTGNVKLPTNKE